LTGREEGGLGPELTGERLVPELQHGQVVHAEHLVRYQLATEIAESRRVLDAACGAGYGTNLLAAAARAATGVDLDPRSIAQARARYPDAEFVEGDIRQLPFDAAAFDLVVCFETIEHVGDPERALDEMRRVLSSDGMLLISTPNKHQYLVENEFHEREFFHEEFLELLSSRFRTVEPLLQHNWLASAVLSPAEASEASGAEAHGTRFGKLTPIQPGAELYTLALCGDGPVPSPRPVVMAAGLDEAHELARRVVASERTAASLHRDFMSAKETADFWHREHKGAEQKLLDVYGSIWWRMTGPLRWITNWVRRRGG
jgi:SAM-dependent methyltransferase